MCYLYLRDAIAAQDAVQETFLKAYKGYEAFRGESQERTWLMSIAINVCRDMNRSAWLRHIDRRVTPEDVPLPAPQDEEALALAEAIRRLPNRHRDVILLYYYQDMTIKEVAEALHAAPSTILKRLNQAKDKLKTLLTEDELSPVARKEGLR
jgi:RNA polymerase sigma-70 factor (ECF subfamily)